MMTAVMMKADTRPARRGSSVGESWTIVAVTETQGTLERGTFLLGHAVARVNKLPMHC